MSYGDDFAGADPAAAPLDPTIMIGADPFFWGAVLLALAVAVLIGWLIGAGSRSKQTDAAGAIWEAVNEAAKAAMQADTEALPLHAAELHRVLRARLGHTLDFGADLNGRVKALEKALGDEIEDPSAPPAAAAVPAAAVAGDRNAPAAAAAATANVTIVSVHPHPPVATAPPPPAKPGKRKMHTKERNDALRLAVADFNDYWRHKKDRGDDMRAIVAELCDPGPRRPHAGSGGGHH